MPGTKLESLGKKRGSTPSDLRRLRDAREPRREAGDHRDGLLEAWVGVFGEDDVARVVRPGGLWDLSARPGAGKILIRRLGSFKAHAPPGWPALYATYSS
jgi:hypothetical protein